jgi:hypothetical protein
MMMKGDKNATQNDDVFGDVIKWLAEDSLKIVT